MRHERFAARAGRRLEQVAHRLEGEARNTGSDGGRNEKARARAGEMRVAARLVRGEAEAVSREEGTTEDPREGPADPPPLRAQA